MKISPELLHRYYDKELSQAQALEVAKALQDDPKLRSELGELQNLSTLLRNHAVQQAESASFVGVFERIEQGITPQPSLLERFSDVWQHGPSFWRWALPLGATATAAAAVLLIGVLRTETPPAQPLSATLPVSVMSPEAPVATGPNSSEIIEVDMGENIGTVIDIEADDGEHVAVLWVEEPELGSESL